jgi:ABC-2 type transport system ATP-binding protein
MRRFILELADGRRTVLVSSHILSELEHISDWLIIIDQGSLVYQGAADGFLGRVPTVIALAPEHDGDLHRLVAIAQEEGHEPRIEDARLIVPVDGRDPRSTAAALNRAALLEGVILSELHLRRPTLESQYLATIEGDR